MSREEPDIESNLVDVVGLTLDEIQRLPETALTHSLRRFLSGPVEPAEQYAGFQNYAPAGAGADPAAAH
jgi:FXSXX-COOH protein